MTESASRVLYSTRSRGLSSDQNRALRLSARNLQEALSAMTSRQSGILDGFEVAITGSGMDIAVSAGLGLLIGADVYPDAPAQWCERMASVVVQAPTPDPANPQWSIVEIRPGVTTATQPRDLWQASVGSFVVGTVAVEQTSVAEIRVRAGTSAATPAMPQPAAGWIPIAMVYQEAAATDLSVGDVVDIRPMLHGTKSVGAQGGGLSVLATSTTECSVHAMEASGPGLPGGRMAVTSIAGLDLDNNDLFVSSQSFPAGVTRLYLYAAAIPLVSLEPTLARMSFVPGSNIGPGARIPSLPAAVAGNTTNCLIIASTTAPASADDLIGDALSGLAINDATFPNTIGASVYLGSATVRASGDLLGLQTYKGAGIVTFAPSSNSDLPAESDAQSSSSQALTDYDARRLDPLSDAGSSVFPDFVTEVRGRLSHSIAGSVISEHLFTGADEGTEFQHELSAAAGYAARLERQWISSTGQWRHSEANGGTSTLTLVCDAYRDGLLARR